MQQDAEDGSCHNPFGEEPIASPSCACVCTRQGEDALSWDPRDVPVMKCSISIHSFGKESLSASYVPGPVLALGMEWLAQQTPSDFCPQLSVCWMRQTLDEQACQLMLSNYRR